MGYTRDQALIVVDIQKDFLPPEGSLAVPSGREVIDVANYCMLRFQKDGYYVVGTQDWHPPNHLSFASNHSEDVNPFESIEDESLSIDTVWPDHCIQNTEGAEFADELTDPIFERVFKKGKNPEVDSYSGFYDNDHEESTGLAHYLNRMGVDDTFILGLAADVCVYYTVLDSIREGFNTHLIEDGIRGVNMKEGDTQRAIEDMESQGAEIISSSDL